MFNDCGLGCMD